MHRLDKEKVDHFLRALTKGRRLFALERVDEYYHLLASDEWIAGKHTLDGYRPVEPLKALVFRPRESVGAVVGNSVPTGADPSIVLGVKNCDLSALAIHDQVFLKSEPLDPFYDDVRDKTLIVSSDCTDCTETCFCTAVGEQPYARAGFDINMSPVDGAYLVEVGSARGEKALQAAEQFLDKAEDSFVQERDKRRAELSERVEKQASGKGLPSGKDLRAAVEKSRESSLWDKFAENCVECGACNFACCTCHCFVLADGLDSEGTAGRLKQWDSCLLKNFARVAGGANPRRRRVERLYNRFEKKFSFFPQLMERYACDGCGRCVEACTGRIDIRDVLKGVLDGA